MKALLGKKLRMTRTYTEDGVVVPLTLIEAGPCEVVALRTQERDGYSAVRLSFGQKKIREQDGSRTDAPRVLQEVRLSDEGVDVPEVGTVFAADQFEAGDTVKITGTTKGRGYTGVVKRWGFAGAPKTHGHKHDLRSGGSIGAQFPQHVMKGMKMAGRHGGKKQTVRGMKVVVVDAEKNLLGVKGSVPGAPGSTVLIQAIA